MQTRRFSLGQLFLVTLVVALPFLQTLLRRPDRGELFQYFDLQVEDLLKVVDPDVLVLSSGSSGAKSSAVLFRR